MKNKLLNELHKKSFEFFFNESCQNEFGYGLVYDNSGNKLIASIAASGYYLSALVIGVESGYISYQEGLYRAIKVLETLLKIDNEHGFFVHFVKIDTLERAFKSEYSTIDTALCLNGVIVADSYFKDERLKELAHELLDRVDYKWLVFDRDNKKYFHMSYNPDKNGSYANGKPGFISAWDMTAEQLMMYVFAANYLDKDDAIFLYESFDRPVGEYDGIKLTHAPGNTLFVYLFPLAWLDLKGYHDKTGFSWFENAVNACKICYKWCVDMKERFRSFSKHSFGISASDSKNGYRVFGNPPRTDNSYNSDGTVTAHAFIGSLPYIPEESIDAIIWIKKNIPGYYGEYGFKDAYNSDESFISEKYYGINKGLELLSLDAYLKGTVHKYYMEHPLIKNGLKVLGFKKG